MSSLLHKCLSGLPKLFLSSIYTVLICGLNQGNYDFCIYLDLPCVNKLHKTFHNFWLDIWNCDFSFRPFNKWTKKHFLENIWWGCENLSMSINFFLVRLHSSNYDNVSEIFRKHYSFEVSSHNVWVIDFISEIRHIHSRILLDFFMTTSSCNRWLTSYYWASNYLLKVSYSILVQFLLS